MCEGGGRSPAWHRIAVVGVNRDSASGKKGKRNVEWMAGVGGVGNGGPLALIMMGFHLIPM